MGEIDALCSGTLVASDVVLTAAHCIANDSHRPWADDFLIVPAANGTYFPFGSALSANYQFPKGWVDSGYDDPRYDLGLIKLASKEPGQRAGSLGVLTVLSDPDLKSPELFAVTIGYPGDSQTGTMWWTFVDRLSVVTPDVLIYDLDIAHGQSGSSIFRLSDRRIFAVVAQGCTREHVFCGTLGGEPLFNNFSVRITQLNASAMASWCVPMGCTLPYEVPVASPSATPTRMITASPTRPTSVATATARPTLSPTPAATPTRTATPSASVVAIQSPTPTQAPEKPKWFRLFVPGAGRY